IWRLRALLMPHNSMREQIFSGMKKFSSRLRRAVRDGRLYGFKALLQQVRHACQDPDAIRYNLDSLESQTFESTARVPVSGWACAEAGIAAIDIYLNNTFLKQITVGHARPDVAAVFPDLIDAGRSGFSEVFDLHGERRGYHTLALAIHDHAGHSVRIERTVRLVASETLYHQYYLHSLPTPHEEETVIAPGVDGQKDPMFELWLVVGPAGTAGLHDTVQAVVNQAYPQWRLHLVLSDDVVVDWLGEDERI